MSDYLLSERNYFKDFEEMLQEAGRPQNIKSLMNHGFKYYFITSKFYFNDIVKGGKCSKNEETNKLYCGYFFFDNGILKKRFIRQYRNKGIKEREEDYKRSTEELLNRVITYPSYNIYVDVFFNFELNKKYDPRTDKNYLLEFIKEYLITFFNDQYKKNTFTDTQKQLFKGYLHNFNEELKQANIININLYLDFLFNTPLLDSFIITATSTNQTNDLSKYLEQTLSNFKEHKKEYEAKNEEIDNTIFTAKYGTKEAEEINSIYQYVIKRTLKDSGLHLTEEEINLTKIEDNNLSFKDKIKKYSILRINNANVIMYYCDRIEDYKSYTPTIEHTNLFKKVFTYSLSDIVLKGQDSVNLAISLLMTNCGKPQISESDLLLLINKDSLTENDKRNLEARINANKEDLKYILNWKKAEQKAISLNNDLKALDRQLKQATKEDQDTSGIIEKINTVKNELTEAQKQEQKSHINIILYNKNYYINKGKTAVNQNDIESGKVEIATKDKSVILLTDTKTAVNENNETYYIFKWILWKAKDSKTREITISFTELNELLLNLTYIEKNDLETDNERKLKYARQKFYTQCEYLQGKTLKYAFYNNGDKPLTTDKGTENIISIRKQGYSYIITLHAFLYELVKISKKYLAIPSKTFEYSYQTSNFLLTTRQIQESNPLKKDPNSYTLEEIAQAKPYYTFISRENYTGKDYERDILKPIKEEMRAVINDNAGTFSEDPNKLKENETFIFTETNENQGHKEHLAKNREKALNGITKSRKKKKK